MRDPKIDILKGLAIFLVVWGHSIQYFGEDYGVLSDTIGKGIYLFHMPLFFFLSGFVSVSSLKKSIGELSVSRLRGIVIPTLFWTSLSIGIQLIIDPEKFNGGGQNIGLVHTIKNIYWSLGEYWYIIVLLYSTIYAKLIVEFFKHRPSWIPIALSLSCIMLYALPDLPVWSLTSFRVFYPFFIIGYLTKYFEPTKISFGRFSLPLFILAYAICYILSKPDFFVYRLSTMNVFGSSVWYIVRHEGFILLAGISGIGLCYCVVNAVFKRWSLPALQLIGKETFGIYMIQGIFFRLLHILHSPISQSPFLYFLYASLILGLCLLSIRLLSANVFFKKLCLGKYHA